MIDQVKQLQVSSVTCVIQQIHVLFSRIIYYYNANLAKWMLRHIYIYIYYYLFITYYHLFGYLTGDKTDFITVNEQHGEYANTKLNKNFLFISLSVLKIKFNSRNTIWVPNPASSCFKFYFYCIVAKKMSDLSHM